MIGTGTILHIGEVVSKPTRKGGQYLTLTVVWQQDGESETRSHTLKDFVDKELFKKVQTLKAGDRVTINIEKDKNGYWQWLSVTPAGQAAPAPQNGSAPKTTQVAGTTGRVTGNNYETPQERGRRQLFTTRAMALKAVLDKMEKIPNTPKQWQDFEDDVLKMADIVMNGYTLNPDDTIRRIDAEINEENTHDDVPY